jgi:hypothetical protein
MNKELIKNISINQNHNRKNITNLGKKYAALFFTLLLTTSALVIIPRVTSDPNDPWWNTDWTYRKDITINHNQIVEDLTEYPLLINIIDTDFIGHTQLNGNDIAFTNQTGVKLNHEIESYDSTTGKLVAWVNIPQLSSMQDTVIYIYYDNPTSGNQQTPTGTWNANFMTVNHLKEPWSTTAGNFKDSTNNHHDGTLTDANANSSSDTGIAGKGFRFGGGSGSVGDSINIGAINQPQPITYSCWLKADNIVSQGCALGRYYYGYYLGTWNTGAGRLRYNAYINNVCYYYIASSVLSNTWYYMAVTYDGATIRYYLNGNQISSATYSGDLSRTTSSWHIGDSGNGGNWFKGVVDEVQITNNCRSAGWIKTYYNNVNNPGVFYTVGIKEMKNAPPVVSDIPDQTITEGSTFTTITLDNYVTDEDPDTSITWAATGNSALTVDITNRIATITYPTSWTGSETITFTATDTGALTSSDPATFTVIAVNNPSEIANENPTNGTTNLVEGNIQLSAVLTDADGDLMNIIFKTNASGTWADIQDYLGQPDGTYTEMYYFSETNHQYWWSVNCTDGKSWTNETYWFKTREIIATPPTITNPQPTNGATNLIEGNIQLIATLTDSEGNPMDLTFRTNATGTWANIGTYLYQPNGTYNQMYYFSQSNHCYWWSINCTDGTFWTNQTFTFSTKFGKGDWWNSAWLYRKWIVVKHTSVGTDVTNFPILINTIDNDLKMKAQPNGYDIVFTSEDGVKLNHEIESYDSATGKLVAWVNIPQLLSTQDTTIFMYYHNPLAGNQQTPTGTWNANFMTVNHLKEPWSITAGNFKDSTSNHHDGTLTDANANSNSDTGIAGSGFRFYGDADSINIGAINQPKPITYSCWLKADNIVSQVCALGRYYYGYYLGTWNTGTGRLRYNVYINNIVQNYIASSVLSNTWYFMAVTYDGTAIRYYLNGNQISSATYSGDLSRTTSSWHIGDSGNGGNWFKGVVDEVQITNNCLSAGWIKTYYNNLNIPSTFYTLSVEENPSGFSPVISNENPLNTSNNNQLNPVLQATVFDVNGDEIYCEIWTNASGSWNLVTSTTVYTGSGTVSGIPTGMTQQTKKYWWSVHAIDVYGSRKWINKTYWFVTGIDTPVISDVYPNNQDANYNPRLSVKIQDYMNDPLTVIFRKRLGTAWETISTQFGYNRVYTQNTVNMDVKDQTYYWSVNVSDGKTWVNRSYNFRAKPFVQKWVNTNSPWGTMGPLAVDVNHDGIFEVFQTGEGKVICVNGSTGALIWQYSYNQICEHSPFQITDLNNDSIPEIIISCNISQAGILGRTIALHANDGSLYWNVEAPSDRRHLVVADIDGNGYPYVYICCHVGNPGLGQVRMLRGTDGTILRQARIYYPCYGGLSIADMDNDGTFELVVGDHYSGSGYPGKGVTCFDARTLKLKWFDYADADPQIPVLVDVNNDGVLDSVTADYPNGDLKVIDGSTGARMTGKWGGNPTFPSHSAISAYDIDADGRLEVFVCTNSVVKVFDLGLWSLDATLGIAAEPPFMADVIGDSRLEIISTHWSYGIRIYNGNYQLLETIPRTANRWTCVQDVDNDGQNELLFTDGNSRIECWDTSTYAPTPRVRTGYEAYSERHTGAGVYIPPPGPSKPILKEEYPVNKSKDVTLNPTLSVYAVDYQVHEMMNNYIVEYKYDKMNITISTNASGTWQNLISWNNTGNARYTFTPTNMNQPDTTYYWRVTAKDINPSANGITTTKTYRFSTKSAPKINSVTIQPPTPYQGQDVNITASISEDVKMDVTKLRIHYPDGSNVNQTLYQYQSTTLAYDDFEQGWGNYSYGGAYSSIYTATYYSNPVYAGTYFSHNGLKAAQISNSNVPQSTFFLTNPIDIDTPGYNSLRIEFWFNSDQFSENQNWFLDYYNGTTWQTRREYRAMTGSFAPEKNTNSLFKCANYLFFHDVVWINESTYRFPTNMNIRFRGDTASSSICVYLDQIYINATTNDPPLYKSKQNFSLPGLYDYSIWCKDINGNTATSDTYQFTVI